VQRQFVADFSRVCAAGPPGPDNPVVRELSAPPAEDTAVSSEVGRPVKRGWWRRLLALLRGRRAAARR
jgi:hypothetical protein